MLPARLVNPVPLSAKLWAQAPPWARFALLCTLFLLSALCLDSRLAPLCRATAFQVGALLHLAGLAPEVRGDLVTVSGFTVRIVTECTPLYPTLLYGAFVLAHPATLQRTLAGLCAGVSVIAVANLLRISCVTAVGPAVANVIFDILHVYLGQVAMLMLVIAAGLLWLRWSGGGSSPLPFLVRSGLVATLLFVPWLAVNRLYVALLDHLVAILFSILYPEYRLLTPRPFAIYNHTFAVPLFVALVLAGNKAASLRPFRVIAAGTCLLAGWHALFRGSHVVWTALDVPEMEPFHQAIYLLGQFLLPFLIWIRLDRDPFRRAVQTRALPVVMTVTMLLAGLCATNALAADSTVAAYYNGRGGFTIKGENLNRVTEAEIRVEYKSEQASPQVTGAGMGAQAALTVDASSPGAFTIRLRSGKPISGHALLAIAQIQGTVTFMTGWLRNDKGATETPLVAIRNPTDEQLDAMAGRRSGGKANPPAPRPAIGPVTVTAPAVTPTPPAAGKQPVASPARVSAPRTLVFSRRKSVLEGFIAHSGDRSPKDLARLFERRDDMFQQEPPVLLSDGASALRLMIRVSGTGESAPRFAISKGSCIDLKIGDDGRWALEIVPERGTLATSVTVLSEGEMIEFPLAVAPPMALYPDTGAKGGEAEYVIMANRLALGKRNAAPE